MNSVVLIGRLVKDPELKSVPGSSMSVANFTIAIDKGLTKEKKREFEEQGKPTADFIRIVVWGKQAENCSQYLQKGRLVAIQGSIQSGQYKAPNGEVKYTTDVLASRVEFLEWGDKPNSQNRSSDFVYPADGYGDYDTMEDDDDDLPF